MKDSIEGRVSGLPPPEDGPPPWQVWLRNGLSAIFLVYAFSQLGGFSQRFDPMMLSGSAVAIVGL
jgi:hypothetical protein